MVALYFAVMFDMYIAKLVLNLDLYLSLTRVTLFHSLSWQIHRVH